MEICIIMGKPSVSVTVRIPTAQARRWRQAARREGKTLSQFLRDAAERAAEYLLEQQREPVTS
jgi:uncharacterized protein (DUF1778 family)